MAKTQSLATGGRVLDVLQYLLRADYATGVSPLDIAREVGLTPSAVTRYLATLEECGCLERDPSNGRLRVWIRILEDVRAELQDDLARIEAHIEAHRAGLAQLVDDATDRLVDALLADASEEAAHG